MTPSQKIYSEQEINKAILTLDDTEEGRFRLKDIIGQLRAERNLQHELAKIAYDQRDAARAQAGVWRKWPEEAPDSWGTYLVTSTHVDSDEEPLHVWEARWCSIKGFPIEDGDNCWRRTDGGEIWEGVQILAWMPLPAPYEGTPR